jgi:hypothetical protein
VKGTETPAGLVASTPVISAGTPENAGGVVSTTVTVNHVEALFPAKSVHVQITAVVPSQKVSSEFLLQINVGAGSTISVAVGGT